MGRDAFQTAAEAGDMTALAETLDPNIRFRGPAFAEPAQGREQVAAILSAAFQQVYQDFRYVDVVEGANRTVLLFRARVGDHQMEGAQATPSRIESSTRATAVNAPRSLYTTTRIPGAMARRSASAG